MRRSKARGVLMVAYAHYPQDPRIRREAQSLVRAGISVSIICLREEGAQARETIEGVDVIRVPLTARRGGRIRYLFQYLVFMIMVLAKIGRVRAHVPTTHVHVHSVPDFLVLVAVPARVRGLRVVLDLHEAMPELVAARFQAPATSPIVALARAAETLSCMLAHNVITVNERIRSILVQRGVPPKKLTVIFNSPAIDFALPNGPGNRIVYAGGLNRERDIDVMIRAFGLVRNELGVPLVIYGQGEADYVNRLERLIGELGLRGEVEMHGQVPYRLALEEMARSIVGIVPYERNPITEVAVPNKLFEFALVRRPLVVADLPAMREVFEDAALYYSPGNPDDLAEKIRLCCRGGPDVQARLEGAARIATMFGWRVMENRLLKLYDKDGGSPEECLSAEGQAIT